VPRLRNAQLQLVRRPQLPRPTGAALRARINVPPAPFR
jgi:hypothetical protein